MTRYDLKLSLRLIFTVVVTLVLSPVVQGADWPTYRHDANRSGITDETLNAPLYLQWIFDPEAAPQPAWPEPGKEVHRMPFDYAYQVAVGNGIIYWGSSADCKVYALDAATGHEKWHYFTDAPVRFAPIVDGDRLYVCSDDGLLYGLNALNGELLWRVAGGLGDQKLIGNERLISRWPLRSGAVLQDGLVYFTAGMWPLDGVYLYAVNGKTGEVVWQHDSSEKAIESFSPQGYLAAGSSQLFFPAGRAKLSVIQKSDGKHLYDGPGNGGTVFVSDDTAVGMEYPGGGNNINVRVDEATLDEDVGLLLWNGATGKKISKLIGKQQAVLNDAVMYAAGGETLGAYDLSQLSSKKDSSKSVLWEIPVGKVYELILAGSHLVIGGHQKITIVNASDGAIVETYNLDGETRGLAVANGRLVASSSTGRIYCFALEQITGEPPVIKKSNHPIADSTPPSERDTAKLVEDIIAQSNCSDGYCLLVGINEGVMPQSLAERTSLMVYGVGGDEKTIAKLREKLDAKNLYGTRVTVLNGSFGETQFPEYFANLLVVQSIPPSFSAAEVYRLVRPYGGTLCVLNSARGESNSKSDSIDWLKDGGVPESEITVYDSFVMVRRGPLDGAGTWTHQYADAGNSGCSNDALVQWPLRLQWFGKPGPSGMPNRHWRASAPLCIGGRLFIEGQHCLMALDPYNGHELWSRSIPSVMRRVVDVRGGNLVADAENLYVATGDICLRLASDTGQTNLMYRLPFERPVYDLQTPQRIELTADGKKTGDVSIQTSDEWLELQLTSFDKHITNPNRMTAPTRGDSWELFFDFRGDAQRNERYENGAFQVAVVPPSAEDPTASWKSLSEGTCPPLVVDGRLTTDGSQTSVRIAWKELETLSAKPVTGFNFGLILNSSDDGKTLVQRSFKHANAASYRLNNCWASAIVNRGPSEPSDSQHSKRLPIDNIEEMEWGYLAVTDKYVIGTMVPRTDSPKALLLGRDFSSDGEDYTGPTPEEVRNAIGVLSEPKLLFALDKTNGELAWSYEAEREIPFNGIAIGENTLYLIDRIDRLSVERNRRRGASAKASPTIVALDLNSGNRLWQIDKDLVDTNELRLARDVLLATDMDGMTAIAVQDGAILWTHRSDQCMHHCSAFVRAPVVAGDWVYDEPHAFDLHTGELKYVKQVSSDESKAWEWGGLSGCGTVSSSANILLYRGGTVSFCDVAQDTGTQNFYGIRPGCYLNMIPAAGLVLIPNADSGCRCSFNFQTSVALIPTGSVASN